MQTISLSPSKLSVYRECPRCFHDAYASKCPKPRGIFPSLPGGMDGVIKKYVDNYRGELPPMLKGKVDGLLMSDVVKMNKWRNWRSGLTYIDEENNIKLIGALDDCLVDGEFYIPLDWKTKGSQPKDDGSQYYQTQLDCYNLMLRDQDYRIKDEGYLVYFYPTEGKTLSTNAGLGFYFGVDIYKLQCSADRAKEIIIKAAECLRGNRPRPASSCEHCSYLRREDLLTKEEI